MYKGMAKMEELLDKCSRLPSWCKQRIQLEYEMAINRKNGKAIESFINLDGEREENKLNDAMVPELIKCLMVVGDDVNKLVFDNNKLSSKGVSLLLDSFHIRNASYKGIYFESNLLDDNSVKIFGEYIQKNQKLQEISIGSGITDKGIESLATYLVGNLSLKKLILRGNKGITAKSVPLLLKIIESSCIVNNPIRGADVAHQNVLNLPIIHNMIKFDSGRLLLSAWPIDDEMMITICEYLKKYGIEKWKDIEFKNNSITSKGASVLFDTLKEFKSVASAIGLSQNGLGDECMKSLGEYIQQNPHLEHVNVSYNTISDKGVDILTPYFEGNTKLSGITLGGNNLITEKSITNLVKMAETSYIQYMTFWSQLKISKAIESAIICNAIKRGSTCLNLSDMYLNDFDILKLIEYLQKYGPMKLQTINLGQNRLSVEIASRFFPVLKQVQVKIEDFTFHTDNFNDDYIRILGEFIQENDYFERCTLDNKEITDEHIKVLSEYLIGNTKLKSIQFYWNHQISNESIPYFIEIAKKSHIENIIFLMVPISDDKKQELQKYLSIPIDNREIPLKSNTKSAAKIS